MAKRSAKTAKAPEKSKVRTGLYHARKARDLSQERLATAAGTTKQTVNRLETGVMELTREWAERFAPHLGISAPKILFWDLTGKEAAVLQVPHHGGFADVGKTYVGASIPIVGVAEAGTWRAMPDFDGHEADLPTISGRRSTRYPNAKHFALEVRGDSMNAAKPVPILDGMVALCVDLVSADIEVESGNIYAVRQTRDGGQTYESTIKRAKVFRDRVELVPESTNPNHKPLVIRHGSPEGSTNEVVAIGLVYFAGYDFER